MGVPVSGWRESADAPAGRRNAVHMLVVYGVKLDGTRHLLAFQRSSGESQQAWEGLLHDLYRRGLTGSRLQLIITDGCPGLTARPFRWSTQLD